MKPFSRKPEQAPEPQYVPPAPGSREAVAQENASLRLRVARLESEAKTLRTEVDRLRLTVGQLNGRASTPSVGAEPVVL